MKMRATHYTSQPQRFASAGLAQPGEPMRDHLAFFMARIKARHQTGLLMRRYRVWYIDSPQAASVDRWWKPI